MADTIGKLKTAYDLAKDLVNLHDTTARQGKVAELQRQILDAQLTDLARALVVEGNLVDARALYLRALSIIENSPEFDETQSLWTYDRGGEQGQRH
jgi:hypothetical protein